MRVLLLRRESEYPFPDSSLCVNTLSERAGITFHQYILPTGQTLVAESDWNPCQSPHFNDHVISREEATAALRDREYDLVFETPFDLNFYQPKTKWLRRAFRGADAVINRPVLQRMFASALQHFPFDYLSRNRQVMVDMSDRQWMNDGEGELLLSGALYYKWDQPFDLQKLFVPNRQTPEIMAAVERNLRYVPLGINDLHYERLKSLRTAEKRFDVIWAGKTKNTQRAKIVRALRELQDQSDLKILILDKPVPPREFYHLVAQSRLTLSAEGQGWECWRHLEAVALGSVPVMNIPTANALAYHDLPRELFFDNGLRDFEETIRQLIASPRLRDELTQELEVKVQKELLWSKIMDRILSEALTFFPGLAPARGAPRVSETSSSATAAAADRHTKAQSLQTL